MANWAARRRWPATSSDEQWMQVFDRELAQLRADVKEHRDVFLHEEAAENRAELFAYSTEMFLRAAARAGELHPQLFECLLGFYKTDPRKWFECLTVFSAPPRAIISARLPPFPGALPCRSLVVSLVRTRLPPWSPIRCWTCSSPATRWATS